jgi:hypothetical protein
VNELGTMGEKRRRKVATSVRREIESNRLQFRWNKRWMLDSL